MKRNCSFFKKISPKTDNSPDDDDDDYISRKDDENDKTTRRSTRARVQTRRFGDPVDSSLIP